jgi:hypothetical protein
LVLEIKMSMNDQERQVIESLFTRIGEVERQAPARDSEAEAFIQERIKQQPGAPYYMAQTLVMQEYALQQAQQQIEELERRNSQGSSGGGLLSNLFGGNQNTSRLGATVLPPRAPASGGRPMSPLQPRGGGFLAGAAQTAIGVAGGVLLGNAIASMFGANEAGAAEAAPSNAEDPTSDEPTDEGGGFFGDDVEF